MRLNFPKGEHNDVLLPPGETIIGSAPGNHVVLSKSGIQPQHAGIVVGDYGCLLLSKHKDASLHVNARPIKEKALLRLGDIVSLHHVNLLLKPDSDENMRFSIPATTLGEEMDTNPPIKLTTYRETPTRVALRGVSGPYFGKVVPVHGRLLIGRGPECDLVLDENEMSRRHAQIEVTAREIYLRDLGSTNGTYVNGVQVKDTILRSGDQLAFDRNRFLVEAPGVLPISAERISNKTEKKGDSKTPMITQTMRAIGSAQTEEPYHWNPWYLIGAGFLIAFGLGALLWWSSL